MSRVSSLVVGTVLVGVVGILGGCQAELSIKTKTRFAEDGVVKEDNGAWTGQPIKIKVEGVGMALNGGVTVTAVKGLTKVKATARMLALAFDDEKANADQSILDAKETFTVSNTSSGILVTCGHGGTHGSSNAGESGCEFVDVQVPAGEPGQGDVQAQPLDLTVLSGNGVLTLQLSNAFLSNLGTNSNSGSTSAVVPATLGASISLVSEKADDIAVTLPSTFAADEVILQAEADKIDLGPFTDVKNGSGAGGRGAVGTGLKLLKLTSKEFAGGTGQITLR